MRSAVGSLGFFVSLSLWLVHMAVFPLCLHRVLPLDPNLLFLQELQSDWLRAHPTDLILI